MQGGILPRDVTFGPGFGFSTSLSSHRRSARISGAGRRNRQSSPARDRRKPVPEQPSGGPAPVFPRPRTGSQPGAAARSGAARRQSRYAIQPPAQAWTSAIRPGRPRQRLLAPVAPSRFLTSSLLSIRSPGRAAATSARRAAPPSIGRQPRSSAKSPAGSTGSPAPGQYKQLQVARNRGGLRQ